MASFDPIGPYSLSRWDRIVASLHITFRVAPWWFAVLYGTIYLAIVASLVIGIMTDTWLLVGASGALILILLLSPALRSSKDLTDIILRPAPDGLEIENSRVRSICKWSLLRTPHDVGRLFYIPIGVRVALAVRHDATSVKNLAALKSYVEAGIADE
jgi:predicted Abi (CAAX) family protease